MGMDEHTSVTVLMSQRYYMEVYMCNVGKETVSICVSFC